MRSALVIARCRQSASIRAAIAAGKSIVMRLVGRSERGWMISFIREYLLYFVEISRET
jgi:hypothetical protein